MNPLWESQAMVEAMGGRPVGTLPEGVTGISIDSRTLKQGEAFFAIRGERTDGHDFATAATAAGAALLVVSEAKLPALGRLRVPMIVVDDVLRALEHLGFAARARTKARIIAITGSAGKTTTKEMLRLALAPSGKVHASDRSFNNHWGVPLTLARMPEDTSYGIFEIGMNHPGEIRPLVKLVRPHIAIITLIAAAHLGHFKNLGEIAEAKAEIFEGVASGGHVILNRDDPHFSKLAKLAKAQGIEKIHGFGEHARAKFKIVNSAEQPDGSTFMCKIAGQKIAVKLGTPGGHMVQNALAVLGAVHLAGGDIAKAAIALGDFTAGKGRGETTRLRFGDGEITLIDESYNANPASMAAAIDLLDAVPVGRGGRRIAVLGDMLELGEHSQRLHAGLAEKIAESQIDEVFLAGPEMKALADVLTRDIVFDYCETVDELEPILMKAVRNGDALMVKSSNGSGFSRIVDIFLKKFPPIEALGDHFSEREKE
jgi:UDP-N-acetylmuramoyl-tripeptide--D-alanyl-D-alanine ligase